MISAMDKHLEVEEDVPGHPHLHSEFQVSPEYMRHCLKKGKKEKGILTVRVIIAGEMEACETMG